MDRNELQQILNGLAHRFNGITQALKTEKDQAKREELEMKRDGCKKLADDYMSRYRALCYGRGGEA